MEGRMRYPVLEVDLEAVRQNAEVMSRLLGEQGIDVAGVFDKPSAPGGARKNWSGQVIEFEDLGVRTRAIAAIGSQDIGNALQLVPKTPGVSVVAGSSDHTVLDVTDSGREWKPGDVIRFSAYYMPLLYCFATRHVKVEYK